MAKIWPVYEGREPNSLERPWAVLPLGEVADLFKLRPEKDFRSDLGSLPKFGDTNRDHWYAGYKHIVIEIEPKEAENSKWSPGFYTARVTPKEAFRRLLQHAMASGLGRDIVVGLEYEPSIGSRGEAAISIFVVVRPDAVPELKGRRIFEGTLKLRERLHEMGDDRTPIVQYVTEAELAEVVGH
jgi:hypothetical protein